MFRWLTRHILDPLSAALAFLVYHGVRVLPLDAASALGGLLARVIGPCLPLQRVARDNLRAAFPEKSEAEIATILSGMWDNLGRTFFEIPHIARMVALGRVEMVGLEHAEALRDDGRPGLFWSAHLGNWELTCLGASQIGMPLHRIYRRPNNRSMDWLFSKSRAFADGELLPKGAAGAKRAMALLKKGGHLAMMLDQKMNDGIAVPFFGRPAMTASALGAFAVRYECPIVALRAIRTTGAHFRVEFYPPYTLNGTGNRVADEQAAMVHVNAVIESWIREHPEQWLWVHRRWPKTNAV
ncbi:MAG: lauroyl acyltransferase [Rhodospirillaceae bacterium]|nr:lauroyl acyltransferase [Rhodospirillaceae bacterium]